jgi:uncharacterized protein DUF1266
VRAPGEQSRGDPVMDWPLWLSPLWYIVALAVVGSMLYYYFGGARQRILEQLADARDPVRGWAKGVYGIITGGSDHAYSDKRKLRLVLRDWWGINDTEQFQAFFGELAAKQPRSKPEAAWCWVRAVNLARMAAGAQFISYAESWRLIAAILPRLQMSFAGWEDLGQCYLAARDDWVRENDINPQSIESVEDNINGLRATVWRNVAFDQLLDFTPRRGKEYATADRLRVLWYIAAAAIDGAIRFRALLVIAAFVIVAAVFLGQAYLSSGTAEKELVGTWLGELIEVDSIDGKTYDTRRWLMVMRPDRTATRTMRWYLGRQKQEEVVTQYEWSVNYDWGDKALVWRLVCKQNSPGYECANAAYRFAVNPRELRYSSGRAAFTMRKVSEDHRLP